MMVFTQNCTKSSIYNITYYIHTVHTLPDMRENLITKWSAYGEIFHEPKMNFTIV